MTIVAKPRNRQQPNYYVYYNDWTGEILSAGRTPRDDTPANCLVTQSSIIKKILEGTATVTDFIVCQDQNNEYQVTEKSEFLNLRKKEDSLFVIPQKLSDDWDISVHLYAKNNILLFKINNSTISRLVSRNVQNNIVLDKDIEFEFYLTKSNQPDYLFNVIKISAIDLINYQAVAVDISDIRRHVNITDVSIMTRRYFQNYSLNILQESYIDTTIRKPLNENLWSVVDSDLSSHIIITQQKDQITIRCKASAQQLNDLNVTDRYLSLFVVGNTPDQYLGKISLDIAQLRTGQIQTYKTNIDIDTINFLYHNSKLRIGKRKLDVINSN